MTFIFLTLMTGPDFSYFESVSKSSVVEFSVRKVQLVMVEYYVLLFAAVVVEAVAVVVAVVLTLASVQMQTPVFLKRLVRFSDVLLFADCTSEVKN